MTSTTSTNRPNPEARVRREVTRRRFLQGALAAGGATALDPGFFRNAAFAGPPLGAADRIIVLVEQDGGNDGLNTVVPIGDGTYYSRRGTAANATTAGAATASASPPVSHSRSARGSASTRTSPT